MSSSSPSRIRQRDSASEKNAVPVPPKNQGNTASSVPHAPQHHPNVHVKEAPHLPHNHSNSNKSNNGSPRLSATSVPAEKASPARHSGGGNAKVNFSLDAATAAAVEGATSTNNTHSPPVNVGLPAGSFFPTNPSPSHKNSSSNNHHHPTSLTAQAESSNVRTIHHHALHTSGASPDRGASPRNSNHNNQKEKSEAGTMGSRQNTNNNDKSSKSNTRHPSQAPSTATTSTNESNFIAKAAPKLAAALAITTVANNKVPPEAQLLSISQEICEKLYEKGLDYAQSHLADLIMAIEEAGNEDLRLKIRNHAVAPSVIANLKMMDLLTTAQKSQLKKEADADFKAHNMKDITRAVAAVTKTETCPTCGHKEAAILESNNAGGQPRFWSGGELEEQQQMTLYKCMSCDHEWSGESKF